VEFLLPKNPHPPDLIKNYSLSLSNTVKLHLFLLSIHNLQSSNKRVQLISSKEDSLLKLSQQ